MSGQTNQAENLWSVGGVEEPDFVLEEDDQFGLGALEGVNDRIPEPIDDDALTAGPALFDDAPDAANAAFDQAGDLIAPPAPISENGVLTDQPIPRITINAFCDRAEIARLIDLAAQDRRLSKAHVKIEMGGVDAAVARLAAQASPNLLILDTISHGAQMLGALDRLAEVVEEGCKVVIIGAVNDIPLFRELMRRGVSEYLVPPIQPLSLIRTIAALYVSPDKPFLGRLISVIGARGGVGASTIAHNIAWSISERQEAGASLVDLDLNFGTAALDFNQDPAQSIADALVAPDRADEVFLDRIMTRQTQRLNLFAAPGKLEREYELEPAAFETVIERIRRGGPFIVLDLPHQWSPWVKQTLLASDDVVIVATPDLASLRNTKNLVDLIKASRPYDSPPRVVVNMCGVPKRPEVPLKDFGEALGVPIAQSIMFEPALFGVAANNGQMLGESQPLSKPAQAIDELAAALTGRKPVEQKRPSLTAKLPFLKR
ncbi:MAG: AAA family ATPase [Hydrogenophilaceae bacterium]|jgi:pilus assembly protein CpaE|nr:AAA family ATPase [Hydrogenophilaceae bacterium]